jgi:imidazole glycerol phosphate synthase subunit HisF
LANGSDTLDVPAGASSFTMPDGVAYGSDYKVTVTAQPTGLTCDVADGSGTIGASAVTNISITCTDEPLTVGGGISGLEHATGLILANGAETYSVPKSATSFTLDTAESPGGTYAVRVLSQPAGVTCSVGKGSGTIPTHSVTDVSVTCSHDAYDLGGTVAGLTISGLVLSDGADSLSVPANAANFRMPTPVAYGSDYTVSVLRQPAGLTCTIGGGNGTMPASEVADVAVTCAATAYTVGGSISGLRMSGLILTDGMDDLTVSANAAQFSMPNALAYGSDYAITIKAQPSSGTCQIIHGTGMVSANVDTVQVICEPPAP